MVSRQDARPRPSRATALDLITLVAATYKAAHTLAHDEVTSFLRELSEAGGLTLHVRLLHGEDARHVLEAIFKALGGALAAAGAPRKE